MKEDWQKALQPEMGQAYFHSLMEWLEEERRANAVYPPREQLYTALELCGYGETKVVILGQDPYHGPGQAHGLSFSVADSQAKFPPSLRNIFKELKSDLGVDRSERNLSDWASQGVLLLNTVLTVRAGQAGSHRGRGWERFTDAVIRTLDLREEPVIFVLWGKDAQSKGKLLHNPRHVVIASAHPSPLSAHNGFFGSRPFSRVNSVLESWETAAITWG